ncbi:HNH endonuclease signature motif containing protein [Paucisalibacillus globulus]|uniref:HNH endonuclease signature motif containing protein n=1 Tax=Paucisalibacillus globulus TaxID=351095 RepID=UPI000BB7013D|nr:HNH endonuclease signature motif containing protein [Paucisalibacillus globulus]
MSQRYKYSDEEIEYVRKIAPGKYNDEIAALFNEKFGTQVTESQMKSLKSNHKIKSNVPKYKPDENSGLFTKEQKDFIKANVKGLHNYELAELVNNMFGLSITAQQMNTYKSNHNLSSGLDGRFEKGSSPWNKGKKGLQIGGKETQFKKGQQPKNYRPVGSERIDSKDGYILIKVQDHGTYQERWRHKHVVVWEKHHGKKVPKNHVIMFADSNKQNLDLGNLILISRSELARMNQQGLFSMDPEVTKAGLNLVRLGNKIMDYEYFRTNPEEFERYLRIAKTNGLTEQGFMARLKRGWSLEEALYKPKHYRMKRSE